jgi:hypothetical protein
VEFKKKIGLMLEKRFYFQFDDMKKNSENFQQNKKFN